MVATGSGYEFMHLILPLVVKAFVLKLRESGSWEAGCGLTLLLIQPFMWFLLLGYPSLSCESWGTAEPCWNPENKALEKSSLFSRAINGLSLQEEI